MAANTRVLRACLIAALALAAWVGSVGAAKPDTDRRTKSVDFETLGRGLYGVCSKPTLISFRHECEWTTAMADLQANGDLLRFPAPSAPGIDWSRKSVLLLSLGLMDGYLVEVRKVCRVGNRLLIEAHLEPTVRRGEVDPSPYHLVVLDTKAAANVEVLYNFGSVGVPLLAQKRSGCSQVKRGAEHAVSVDSSPDASWGTLKMLYR